MEKCTIVKDLPCMVRRYKIKGHKIQFKIKSVPQADNNPVLWFRSAIEEAVRYVTRGVLPTDKVGFTFCGDSFNMFPGWISYRDASSVSMDDIWNMVSKIFQSNSEGFSTDTFWLEATTVRVPMGSGRSSRTKYNNFEEECTLRKGIVSINNKDNLCLPRALIVAIAKITKDPLYNKIRKDTGMLQTRRAEALCSDANITIPANGAGIPELQLFQNYLSSYKIVVYRYGSRGRDRIFEGVEATHTIYLLYSKGHYNVITSLTSAFASQYFCEKCHVPYCVKNKHRCGGSCPCCQQSPACEKDNEILCPDCNRKFRGIICFNKHKTIGSLAKGSVCAQVRRCDQCLKTVRADRVHNCGEEFCKICSKHVPPGHLCFIQTDTRKAVTKDILFVFYDLETRQERNLAQTLNDTDIEIDKIKLHEPNLCISMQRCDECLNYDQTNSSRCNKCGVRQHIFEESTGDVISNFMNYIMDMKKTFKKVIVIAHNGQAFDHQFIFKYIVEKTDIKPKLIMRGTKIILMYAQNVKFIDSLNYFPMPLCKLPKAFDLDGTIFKKGYFPHLFNTIENSKYIGSLPAIEYYSPDSMKPEDREIFLKWYEEHKCDQFDMQRDLVEYCLSDVRILTEACLKFHKLFLNKCAVAPFTEAVTIASACNLVYRRKFLKPSTIGIIPRNGYRYKDNQSVIAVQWLLWEEQNRGIDILHAAKQKEVNIHGVKVDGYCPTTKQIFQFNGCFYHGHPQCFPNARDDPLYVNSLETIASRYDATVARTERLRSLGFEVIEMWECTFKEKIKSDPSIKMLANHPLMNNRPLTPRSAFYGGRCGNTKLYYKAKAGEKIKYIDVCSLYPWVCKYGKFPIGHPEVYVGNEVCSKFDLHKINGLIKCTILPPDDLYHPVLPLKMNNKLMFVLCRTCGEDMNQNECVHTIEQKSLTGTWVLDEVLKALEKGYKILNVYEIWKYDVEQYDRFTKKGGLFTEMMNYFLQMKQQASGWPSEYDTKEQMDQYIAEFLDNEGIELDFNNIENNPGLRALSKLILNSFWGKFGQRSNMPKTDVVSQPHELYALINNPTIDVNPILPINDKTVIVNWVHKEEIASDTDDTLSTVNVCIAAYTTAQARLQLYTYLEKLGDRVLYYDTDSVIYVSREDEYDPPIGCMVGDMTNELSSIGPETYITEFVSGGPKNYSFLTYSPLTNSYSSTCKVKGICLDYNASKAINFSAMKNLVLKEDSDKTIFITRSNIRRTKEHDVVTVPEKKMYRSRSEKRKFQADYDSVPYGYKKVRLA